MALYDINWPGYLDNQDTYDWSLGVHNTQLVPLYFQFQGQRNLPQPGQANSSNVANNVKRMHMSAKFHSTSDYREGAVSSSNQHNYTDTVR